MQTVGGGYCANGTICSDCSSRGFRGAENEAPMAGQSRGDGPKNFGDLSFHFKVLKQRNNRSGFICISIKIQIPIQQTLFEEVGENLYQFSCWDLITTFSSSNKTLFIVGSYIQEKIQE